MVTQRYSFRTVLLMGVVSLPFVAGCNRDAFQNPGGGVGGNATVPDRGGGLTPSPVTPAPSDLRTSKGTGGMGSSSDATTRTGTTPDVRPGTGSSAGTGTSPVEHHGSAPATTPRSSGMNPSGNAEKSTGSNNTEPRSGAAGNSGTTSGSGTGNSSSGGTTSKGPVPH